MSGEAKQRLQPIFYGKRHKHLERLSGSPRLATLLCEGSGSRRKVVGVQGTENRTPESPEIMPWTPEPHQPSNPSASKFLWRQVMPWARWLSYGQSTFITQPCLPHVSPWLRYSSFLQTKPLWRTRASPHVEPSFFSVFTPLVFHTKLSPGSSDHSEGPEVCVPPIQLRTFWVNCHVTTRRNLASL